MIKKIKIIKKNQQNLTNHLEEYKVVDIVFRILSEDTIGKSSSNPSWGYVFNVRNGKLKLNIDPYGLYKEFCGDNEDAAYAEKIFSIIGQEMLPDTRVAKTEVVSDCFPIKPATISYKLMDNDKEDMFHISDLMFYKYEREEIQKKKDVFTIEDILECIKVQVRNEENYNKIEKSVIHTILLDSVLNNADRHNNNWALVRNKETNQYDLAIFDHSVSLIDILEENKRATYNGWTRTYISTRENGESSMGNEIIEYIYKNYNEYFNEFVDRYNEKLPAIIDKIKGEELPIKVMRLEMKLNARNIFLQREKRKEEFEYGE